jgi:hypothetical protein
VSGLHASGMKILLMMAVVQSLNLVIFAWFNRVAGLRILVLRQQPTVYKRKSKKPMLRNRDRLFWSLLSRIWRDWTSELIHVRPETVIRWRERKFREFWRRKPQGRSGRSAIANEHIDFIRRISSDHPEYGEDRIDLELAANKFRQEGRGLGPAGSLYPRSRRVPGATEISLLSK